MLKKKQISCIGLIYKMFTLDYFLDDLIKMGFESVELWGAYPHIFTDGNSVWPIVGEVKEKIKSRGLNLVAYTPEQLLYFYNIASLDRTVREKSIAYYKRSLDIAAELETDRMLMTSGWGLYDQPIEEAWRYSRESLRTLSEYAETLGITIFLENLAPHESNLVYSLPTVKKMIDEVQHPCFKAMVDTVPMHLAGERMQDWIDAFGKDLLHVHVIDGTPLGHLAWGKGYLPLDEDVKALVDYGYQNAISFEVAGGDQYHPGMEVSQSMERISRYVGMEE